MWSLAWNSNERGAGGWECCWKATIHPVRPRLFGCILPFNAQWHIAHVSDVRTLTFQLRSDFCLFSFWSKLRKNSSNEVIFIRFFCCLLSFDCFCFVFFRPEYFYKASQCSIHLNEHHLVWQSATIFFTRTNILSTNAQLNDVMNKIFIHWTYITVQNKMIRCMHQIQEIINMQHETNVQHFKSSIQRYRQLVVCFTLKVWVLLVSSIS